MPRCVLLLLALAASSGADVALDRIEAKLDALNQERLPQRCIEDIQAGEFARAADTFTKIKDPSRTVFIVNRAFDGSPYNFNMVLDFAKAVQDPIAKYDVVHALDAELERVHHKDPRKYHAMHKTLKKEKYEDWNMGFFVSGLDLTAMISASQLAARILYGENVTAGEKRNFHEVLRDLYEPEGHGVVTTAIEMALGDVAKAKKVPIVEMMEWVHGQDLHTDHTIIVTWLANAALDLAWKKNKESVPGGSHLLVAQEVAASLRRFGLLDVHNKTKQKEMADKFQNLVDDVPQVIKTVAFHSAFCARNVDWDEVLVTVGPRVVTRPGGKGQEWVLTGGGLERDFALRSGNATGPRLSALWAKKWKRRVVLSDLEEPRQTWDVEIADEGNAYIKLLGTNSYLTAGNAVGRDKTRAVAVRVLKKGQKKPKGALWALEECGPFDPNIIPPETAAEFFKANATEAAATQTTPEPTSPTPDPQDSNTT